MFEKPTVAFTAKKLCATLRDAQEASASDKESQSPAQSAKDSVDRQNALLPGRM
jgi:hypothetical protein